MRRRLLLVAAFVPFASIGALMAGLGAAQHGAPARLSPEGTSPTPPGCYPPECSPCACGPTCDCMLGTRVEIPGTNQHYHVGGMESVCKRKGNQ